MSTSFFQFYSLMQLFLLKAWFPYDHYDCCDHCDRWEKKSSVIAAIIWKPLSRVIAATMIVEIEIGERNRSVSLRLLRLLESGFLMITMITTLRSLYFFFSVITVIVAIIWKPGLSYASLLHKIRFNNYKQEGCIMLFTYSCFNCQNEKGLLNFVSERINIVYRINNTRYNFQKNKLPFKHLKPQFMGPIHSN